MRTFWYSFGAVSEGFGAVFAGVSAADARGEEDVVVAGDDEVGDFVHFGEGLLGAFEIVAVGEDLAGEEVAGGGDGVAGDDGGACGFADEEAALAGGVAGERVEVDAFGEVVGGALDAGEEGAFFGDEFVGGLVLAARLRFGGVEGFGGGFDFGGVHPPGGFGEMFEAAAVHGAPVGEEDVGDVVGFEAGAFVDSGFEGLGGEGGIDEEVEGRFAALCGGAEEGGGGVAAADGDALVPEGVFGEGADADDDEFHVGFAFVFEDWE